MIFVFVYFSIFFQDRKRQLFWLFFSHCEFVNDTDYTGNEPPK